MPTQEPTPKKQFTQTKRPISKVVLDFLNPKYHYSRFKEDMAVTKAALLKRKELLNGQANIDSLPEIFRGKLMGVFFVTGWTNLLGIGAGYGIQRLWDSHWVGLFITPILCYIFTAIGFQIGWWLDNKRIYRRIHKDPAHRFWQLQRDMFPVHKATLPFAIAFNLANFVFAIPLLAIIQYFNPEAAKHTPAGAFIILGEFLFLAGAFVRVIGDFFDKYSITLANRYQEILIDDQPKLD